MQLDITVTGPLDPHRLRDAVHTVINRHPNLAARFCEQFDQPVQIIPADPAVPWRYIDLSGNDPDPDEQIQRVCAAERAAVCDLAHEPVQTITADPVAPWRHVELDAGDIEVNEQIERVCAAERAAVCDLAHPPAFRVALIRTAKDRHRIVLTNHHIVLDGWSLPILLQEVFAGYYGQRLPAAGSYRRFVSWLADRDLEAAHAAWREVLAGFDTPTLVGPPGRLGLGPRGTTSVRVSAETTRALSELARSCHTTVNTVLQAAWAQLLMWLTGQHDVVFGTAVSGRPTEVAGAESMVGLLINTVPVRATHHTGHHHRRPARPTAKRPQRHTRPPAPGAQRDPPRHRPRPAVRHPLRLRELPGRHRRTCSAPTGWPSPRSPVANHNHYPLPWWSGRAANWGCASNSTPTCSTRQRSRRSSSG